MEKTNYYLSQDTEGLLTYLLGQLEYDIDQETIREICEQYFKKVQATLRRYLPESLNLLPFSEQEIKQGLTKAIQAEAYPREEYCIVKLDRYIELEEIELDQYQLEITRDNDGRSIQRRGAKPLTEQINNLKQKIQGRKVILVDDGTFTGRTIANTSKLLTSANIEIETAFVFAGNPEIQKIEDIEIRYSKPLTNLFDWIDIRDFSLLGGRSQPDNRFTKPYLAPFTNGEKASLDQNPNLLPLSQELVAISNELIAQVNNLLPTPLRVKDLSRANLGIPIETDQPEMKLEEINNQAILVLNFLEKIGLTKIPELIIFDMDGTIYQLDGENGQFQGSTLEKEIEQSAISFILEKENCTPEKAREIWDQANSGERASYNLSEKFGISREKYFEAVWGTVDLTKIISEENRQTVKKTFEALKTFGIECQILTAAPKVWANKVIEFFRIEPFLAKTTTAEEYTNKVEIFQQVPNPDRSVSIGDQLETDILPAQNLGLSTFQVTPQKNLNTLTI